MADWLATDDLRGFIKNPTAADEPWLQLACDTAREKVEELCGPVMSTPISDELVEVSGSAVACLRYRPASTLTAISTERGVTLDVSDFRISGRVLSRLDGGLMMSNLLVSYTTGAATTPAWAKTAALLIAQQYLRTMRRFAQTGTPDGPVGFLVPNAAMEAMRDHLLIGGFA